MRYPVLTFCAGFTLLIGCALYRSSTTATAPMSAEAEADAASVWAINPPEESEALKTLKTQVAEALPKLAGLQTTTDEHARVIQAIEDRLAKLETRQVSKPRRLARVLFFSTPPNDQCEPTCVACILLARKLEPQLKEWGWTIGSDPSAHVQHVDDPELAKLYNVRVFPALIVVAGPDDKAVGAFHGENAITLTPTAFVKWVNPLFTQARKKAATEVPK